LSEAIDHSKRFVSLEALNYATQRRAQVSHILVERKILRANVVNPASDVRLVSHRG
jgi:hypothetical protein